jgi:hypothetical protein
MSTETDTAELKSTVRSLEKKVDANCDALSKLKDNTVSSRYVILAFTVTGVLIMASFAMSGTLYRLQEAHIESALTKATSGCDSLSLRLTKAEITASNTTMYFNQISNQLTGINESLKQMRTTREEQRIEIERLKWRFDNEQRGGM